MNKAVLLIATVAVTGCATPRPPAPSGAEIMAADPSNQCFQRMNTQFAKGPLEKKISLGAPPTLEMVIDKTTPNAAEKEALSQLSAVRQQCIELGRSYRQANLPGPVMLALDESTSAATLLMAKLYAGELTFAQFNVARDENRSRLQSRLVDYDRQANQEQAAKQQVQHAQQQQAQQNFMNSLLLQQQLSQPYYIPQQAPVTTDCWRYGANNVQCTSR